MGGAMARRLAGVGFEPLLWNRDRSKADSLAAAIGGSSVASPSEVAAKVDVLISSLSDDTALREVYLGDDGVVSEIGAGTIAVETSTVDPTTVVEVGAAVDAAGAAFLDCPVSGSVSTVEAGGLTIMAGGDADLIAKVTPVLDHLAARIVPVGGRGTGAATKLAVNSLVHGLNVALSEALVLAEKAGVDRSTAYEVFASGAAGAPFVQYKRAAFESPDDAPVAFSLDLMAKDLELITALGERIGAPLSQAATTRAIVEAAIAAGLGGEDMSAIAVYLRSKGA